LNTSLKIENVKVFIACSGLGNISRGYESFTQECFDALKTAPELDVWLFKGGGQSDGKAVKLWNLPRNGNWANRLARWLGRNSYYVEQATFGVSLLFYILRHRPDVIYFSDGTIGNLLWHWRRLTGQKYKLLFSNGGPLSPPFTRWDHVQQVAPLHLETALKAGEPPEKHSLVPYGFNIPSSLTILSTDQRRELRRKLKIPENRLVILSVGAINHTQKRMDYVIKEIASFSPQPFLVMLGQHDKETPEILALAQSMLGENSFQARSVDYQEVRDYYKVSDVFVLASLGEGFGRVFVEAMSNGLLCLAHENEVSHFVVGSAGSFGDFSKPGVLSDLLQSLATTSFNAAAAYQARQQRAYAVFSWDKLVPAYIKLIQSAMS
jgi:glycosyltransferase involved in cell wall biosynthesis